MTIIEQTSYEKVAYKAFAKLHPVEAFEMDNKKFMELLKDQGYDLTIEEVKQIIKEIE